jgi:hypothetical protein
MFSILLPLVGQRGDRPLGHRAEAAAHRGDGRRLCCGSERRLSDAAAVAQEAINAASTNGGTFGVSVAKDAEIRAAKGDRVFVERRSRKGIGLSRTAGRLGCSITRTTQPRRL